MAIELGRRWFVGGLLAALAAPAIIRIPGLLMPVKAPVIVTRTPDPRVMMRAVTGLDLNGKPTQFWQVETTGAEFDSAADVYRAIEAAVFCRGSQIYLSPKQAAQARLS